MRRILIVSAASMLLLLLGLLPAASAARNLLYLIADDFRPEMNVAYGQSYMHTPNFDRLARDGLVFDNAYCQQGLG